MDELYTYIGRKDNKYYVWSAIAITPTGKKFHYYHLSPHRTITDLLEFNQHLPKVNRVYSDENFAYGNIYEDKVIQEKSVMTNIIENLNSQLRASIYKKSINKNNPHRFK